MKQETVVTVQGVPLQSVAENLISNTMRTQAEKMSEETTIVYPSFPDFKVADLLFECSRSKSKKEELRNEMTKYKMVSVSRKCNLPGWKPLKNEKEMELENQEELKKINESIKDAEDNFGVSEIRSAIMEKIKFLSKIGEFEEAIKTIDESIDKKAMASLSNKLDLKFYKLRCLLFYLNKPKQLVNVIDETNKILEQSDAADWDRKNRLKVYEGLVLFHTKRDFKAATKLFLEVLPTYNCYEILDHKQFVSYTVLCSMISLERPELRSKIVQNCEIRQVLFSESNIREFLDSLFECRYAAFFKSLSIMEQYLKNDRFWNVHYRRYVSELKIIGYNQHLQSYSSISLQSMASLFGVTVEMIDSDLSRLIVSGRLNCKIDKINGHLNDLRPDEKNTHYQELIKKGDLLLTRIQKLSRVISF